MKNIRILVKDFAISSGIALATIFFLEASFRISKFVVYNFRLPDKHEKVYRDKFIAFDKKVPIKDIKTMEREFNGPLIYKPWIQIGNREKEEKFGNVVNGRRVVKDSDSLKDCDTKKEIWMFGGSTTYGVGVPFSDNIPSFLQQILNKHNTCLKVINYGVPFHYSKQETIHFVNKLLDYDKTPLLSIFLDGLNDFGQPGATLRGEPHFTPVLTSFVPETVSQIYRSNAPIFNLEIVSYLQRKIFKKTISGRPQYSNYDLPSNYDEREAAEEISKLFIKNTNKLGRLCEAYNVKCFRFLQPVAAVDYIPPSNDALTTWVRNEKKSSRFQIGYEIIRKSINKNFSGISLIDLSYLFEDYVGIPYIDAGHYAPRANKLIAESIYSTISTVINYQ